MDTGNLQSANEVDSRTFSYWISRKRIFVSFVSFTSLIVYNLFIVQTQALDPFRFRQPQALAGLSLVVIGLFIRSWSAGMLRKSEVLSVSGPYALVRNPLYVGSFLMMFGFCLLMRDWFAMAFIVGPMAIVYWFQVKREEAGLSKRFKSQWTSYVQKTGRFFPRNIDSNILAKWSLVQWKKNREYEALLLCIFGLITLHWFYSAKPGF